MKRIHLFELEDFAWFPGWLRTCLTRLMVVMHRALGSPEELTKLVAQALAHSRQPALVDLCSGSGGPMLEVLANLRQSGSPYLTLVLTDLYPNAEVAAALNSANTPSLSYRTTPVDASRVGADLPGVRTMTGSFHHMRPALARAILQNARDSRQPICIYEMSDNSLPTAIWWVSLPLIFLMAFFLTPFARPLTWRQLVFTYLLPIIPLCFAWDGAVSNVRTYTLQDMDELLAGLETEGYTWEKGRITGRGNKLYLLGLPT
ncbi:hypothetical protein [Hymenobacter cellulosivorans]|uniref:Class I SAM-dependent methyltransferase n=1 Tax=Hymenobacter cellulosivorans TaxID=2932249 RepID=A0ABY4F7N8_9BACT|nr:hypothetical protein [Hymenobacter cellulosivorans]UOQ52687.1 hypothetical protein MUN80_23440 [Hymenobacter cellulosivorans]